MKAFTALTILFSVAIATPIDSVEKDVVGLEKRDTEIVYLANCVKADSYHGVTARYSQIIYYPTSASSQTGAIPSSDNRCTVTSDNFVAWEGADRSCTFPTGVWFTSHIDAAAQSYSLYGWAGWGSNTYKNWNCYKDNQRTLFDPYMPESSNSCTSIYYCIPQ